MNLRFTLGSAALFTLTACSAGGGSCFAGSTLIATPRGPRPIRELAIGDAVWSYDAAERRFAIGRVSAIHRARAAIRSVRTAAGVLAAVTDSHPVFVAAKNDFVAAGKLATGEHLLYWNGDPESQPAPCAVLGFSSPVPGDEVEVFNLTVDDAFATFFADGFFVHNKSVDGPGCPSGAHLTMSAPAHPFCVGNRGQVKLHDGELYCLSKDDLTKVVLATNDLGIVFVEGHEVVAISPGKATITALFNGQEVGEATVEVLSCPTDTGVVDSSTPEDASDAAADIATDSPDAGD